MEVGGGVEIDALAPVCAATWRAQVSDRKNAKSVRPTILTVDQAIGKERERECARRTRVEGCTRQEGESRKSRTYLTPGSSHHQPISITAHHLSTIPQASRCPLQAFKQPGLTTLRILDVRGARTRCQSPIPAPTSTNVFHPRSWNFSRSLPWWHPCNVILNVDGNMEIARLLRWM